MNDTLIEYFHICLHVNIFPSQHKFRQILNLQLLVFFFLEKNKDIKLVKEFKSNYLPYNKIRPHELLPFIQLEVVSLTTRKHKTIIITPL